LSLLGLGGPVFALIEEPKRGFGDPLIVATLLGGITLLVLFVAWELRHDAPMLPLRLFRLRNFTFANVETLVVYAALATLTFFLTLFLIQLAGYSPFRSGLATVPITVVMFLLSPRVGRLSMRFGPRLFMGIGPLVCAAALVWMRRLSPGFDYWTELLPPLLVFALGLSLIVAPLTSTVLADAGERDAGIASGVNNAVARVAALLGIAIVGAAIAGANNRLDLAGYRLAMAITAGLIGAAGAHARDPRRHLLRPRRPVRGRQDDGAQARQPPDPVRRGRHPDRRPQHHRAAGGRAPARDRLRDPAGGALPAHDGRREHRDRAATARLGAGAPSSADGRAARARRARGDRREAVPGAAFRRPAPARRARARARGRPPVAADGRAVRRA